MSNCAQHHDYKGAIGYCPRCRIAELEAEAEINHKLIVRQSDLLTGVANALRGEPDEMRLHSHHDLPERAAALREAAREAATCWCGDTARMVPLQNKLAALLQEIGE